MTNKNKIIVSNKLIIILLTNPTEISKDSIHCISSSHVQEKRSPMSQQEIRYSTNSLTDLFLTTFKMAFLLVRATNLMIEYF